MGASALNSSLEPRPKKPFLRRFLWLIGLCTIGLILFAAFAIGGKLHDRQLKTGGQSNSQDIFTSSHFYKDDTTARFTALPTPLDIINHIEPLGAAGSGSTVNQMGAGAHNIPTDHVTVQTGTKGDSHVFPIYAVADSYLVQLDYQPGRWAAPDGTPNQVDEFSLTFQVSKDLFILETHLTGLAPELAVQFNLQPGNQNYPNVHVSAGELLGQGGGSPLLAGFDLWAIDFTKTASFIHPEWYGFMGHSVNALDYFVEPLRSELYAKLTERSEPRAGQFAYDIDGRLVGNWFSLEKGADYQKSKPKDTALLSFFYCWVDPSLIYIGYCPLGMTYVVKGNSPDPANISVQSGIIKYELMNVQIRNPSDPSFFQTEATMLVQMLADRHIKMELFEGKTADEVSGFDANALEFFR